MSIRNRVFVLFSVCLVVGFAIFAEAQVQRRMTPLAVPVVFSGPDVGFRVEGQVGSVPAGRLVVRVNGQWVAPVFKSGEPARLGDE